MKKQLTAETQRAQGRSENGSTGKLAYKFIAPVIESSRSGAFLCVLCVSAVK